MKIYAVHEGKIFSMEVKETEHKYIRHEDQEGLKAFQWGRHFYKQDCDRTQSKAIKRALEKARTKKMKIEAELVKANTEVAVVEHLAKKFKAFLAKKKVVNKGGK